jgi:hypothetical protein
MHFINELLEWGNLTRLSNEVIERSYLTTLSNLPLDELTANVDGGLDGVGVHRLGRLVQAHHVVQLQLLHVLQLAKQKKKLF